MHTTAIQQPKRSSEFQSSSLSAVPHHGKANQNKRTAVAEAHGRLTKRAAALWRDLTFSVQGNRRCRTASVRHPHSSSPGSKPRQAMHDEAGRYTTQEHPLPEDPDHFQSDSLHLVGAPRIQANQNERTAVAEAHGRLTMRAAALWRDLGLSVQGTRRCRTASERHPHSSSPGSKPRQASHDEAGRYTTRERPLPEDPDHFQSDSLLSVGAPRKQAYQNERTAVAEAHGRLTKRAPALWRGLHSQMKQAHQNGANNRGQCTQLAHQACRSTLARLAFLPTANKITTIIGLGKYNP